MKKNIFYRGSVVSGDNAVCGCSESEINMLVGTWKSVNKNDVKDISRTYTITSNGSFTWK